MNKTPSKTFDFLNFFYGLGAAIILVAALFKFLSWPYAEEIYVIGLTSEAIIFLISAFEWKTPSKRYEWDRLFPELRAGEEPAFTAVEACQATEPSLPMYTLGAARYPLPPVFTPM